MQILCGSLLKESNITSAVTSSSLNSQYKNESRDSYNDKKVGPLSGSTPVIRACFLYTLYHYFACLRLANFSFNFRSCSSFLRLRSSLRLRKRSSSSGSRGF